MFSTCMFVVKMQAPHVFFSQPVENDHAFEFVGQRWSLQVSECPFDCLTFLVSTFLKREILRADLSCKHSVSIWGDC